MIWKHYGLLAGCLILAATPLTNTQAQPQNRTTVTRLTAPEEASIEGTVVDATTNKPIAGATILAKNQAGKVVAKQIVGFPGSYHLSLDDSKQAYLTITSADGYETHEEQLAFTTSHSTQLMGKAMRLYRTGTKPPVQQNATTIETKAAPVPTTAVARPTAPATFQAGQSSVSIVSAPPASSGPRLTPPKTLDAKVVYTPPLLVATPGKTTQLRAIQFVQSKAEFLPDAQPALEQLATFLKSNPTTEIELSGHTDNQGDFDENVRLSKQRVDVVKAYLVANGITANRITTRGYGPTRPIGSNNAENTRQLNRRVEMTVLKQ